MLVQRVRGGARLARGSLRQVDTIWNAKEILITEHGCAGADVGQSSSFVAVQPLHIARIRVSGRQ